jgi:hypothetical protein
MPGPRFAARKRKRRPVWSAALKAGLFPLAQYPQDAQFICTGA